MMSLVVSLSRFIILPILSECLDTISLCRLDSAICSSTDRPIFLLLIGNENIKFPGLVDESVCTTYLKWISQRKLRIACLNIDKQLAVKIQRTCLSNFSHLRRIAITNFDPVYKDRLNELLRVTKLLEEFSIETAKMVNDSLIRSLASNCLELTALSIRTSGSTSFADDAFIILAKSCTHIKELDLNIHESQLTDESIAAFAIHCTQLKDISLMGLSLITDKCIENITENCTDLTRFAVSGSKHITGTAFGSFFTAFATLTHIHIHIDLLAINFADRVIEFRDVLAIGKLTSLIYIRFSGFWINDAVLQLLTVNNKQLKFLSLTNLNAILSMEGYRHIATNCPQLLVLSLVRGYNLDDLILCKIASHCIHLHTLVIVLCDQITEKSVIAIGQHCKQLRSLCVSKCAVKVDMSIITTILGSCSQLEKLDLSYGAFNGNPFCTSCTELISVIKGHRLPLELNLCGFKFSGVALKSLKAINGLSLLHGFS